jgi:hypothetical protein
VIDRKVYFDNIDDYFLNSETIMNLVKNKTKEIFCIFIRKTSKSFSYLGAQYGNIDVNQVLRSSHTISSHIHVLADNERARLKKLLTSAAKNGSLCLCPDLWTDSNRQCSYLGVSASFVDEDHQLHNIDLCCQPFPSVRKTAENIIIVSI